MNDKPCVFCQIVNRELPAALVYQDPHAVGFLDARPVFKGHVLLVPREHVQTLPELPEEQVAPLFRLARRLARAMEEGLQADGSFVALNNRVSQSVPHLHVHVVPRHRGDGLRGFFWPRVRYASDAEQEEFRHRIAVSLARG